MISNILLLLLLLVFSSTCKINSTNLLYELLIPNIKQQIRSCQGYMRVSPGCLDRDSGV